jgi:hypothetical protein
MDQTKMEQTEMEQILELLKSQIAGQARRDAKMETDRKELMTRMEASQHDIKATIRRGQKELIKAIKGASPETRGACPEVTPACLEKEEEQAPEETEAVEEPQEVLHGLMEVEEEPAPEMPEAVAETEKVPEGATGEEAIEVNEDRSRNLRQAVGYRGRLRTRTKRDGRLRQECAATIGRPTRRAVPAIRKGRLRKKPGRMCRRSFVRGPGKTSGSRIENRGLKRRRTKDNVVRGTPGKRTCEKRQRSHPECNSGIRRLTKTSGTRKRGKIVKRNRRLDRTKTYIEALRKSPRPEIVRLIFKSYIGLREPGDYLLWKCRPPPKRKR